MMLNLTHTILAFLGFPIFFLKLVQELFQQLFGFVENGEESVAIVRAKSRLLTDVFKFDIVLHLFINLF